ncbi:hypothetical protein [Streptomyces fractus]|uniref:hypothetical protein n=1 Tax=Streptomyces fractus TaxID=641806 RepID=UPI003CEAB3D4
MSDVYALDLAVDLSMGTPRAVLDGLRWHLGIEAECDLDEDDGPLLAERGAALRIGGALVGELVCADNAWHLTARQEVHEETLLELYELLGRLVKHASRDGIIGQIRFYEDEVPDLLIHEDGAVKKVA